MIFLLLCFAFSSASSSTVTEEAGGPIIGIDLGTTYSCVGIFKNGKVEIIANDQGNHITPSYVSFGASGERLVGDAAKNQATINPENTIFDAKRIIGRKYSDTSVQNDKKLLPFNIVSDKADKPMIQVKQGNKEVTFAPEEISAMVLQVRMRPKKLAMCLCSLRLLTKLLSYRGIYPKENENDGRVLSW